MASTDAKPVPQKNVAYRVTFPILDADGDLVTGASSLDSEISKDGGTFADCTSEATEIATSSGVYYLDLTATEMNADTVAIIVKTATSGAKTTTIVMYPEEAGDIRVNVTQFGGTNGTFNSGRPDVNTTHVAGTSQTAGDIIGDTNDIQARLPAALVSGRIDASVGAMASNTVTAAAVATDAVTEIQTGLATSSALATVAGYIDTEIADIQSRLPAALVGGRMDSNMQAAGTGVITAGVIATDAIGSDELAASAANEIADALLDRTAGVETGLTPRQALRVSVAALAGKASGLAGSVAVYRDTNDTVDRISATVDDNGNRTAVTLNTT